MQLLWHHALILLSCLFSSCWFHSVLCRKFCTCPTKRVFVYTGKKEANRNSNNCLQLFEKDSWRHKSQTLLRSAKQYSKGNDHKLQRWGCRPDIRKTFFTRRVQQHWERLTDGGIPVLGQLKYLARQASLSLPTNIFLTLSLFRCMWISDHHESNAKVLQ